MGPPRPTEGTPAAGGLCLLGAYADSDDEEGEGGEKPARPAGANGNSSTDIDSTLANFLAVSAELPLPRSPFLAAPRPSALPHAPSLRSLFKEIDAITAPPQPAEPTPAAAAPPPTPPRPEPKEPGTAAGTTTANGTDAAAAPEWQYDTQCSLAGGESAVG